MTMTSMTRSVRQTPQYVDIDRGAHMRIAGTTFIGGECFIEIEITGSYEKQTCLVLHEKDAQRLSELLDETVARLNTPLGIHPYDE